MQVCASSQGCGFCLRKMLCVVVYSGLLEMSSPLLSDILERMCGLLLGYILGNGLGPSPGYLLRYIEGKVLEDW